jgi:hypothetical protein
LALSEIDAYCSDNDNRAPIADDRLKPSPFVPLYEIFGLAAHVATPPVQFNAATKEAGCYATGSRGRRLSSISVATTALENRQLDRLADRIC